MASHGVPNARPASESTCARLLASLPLQEEPSLELPFRAAVYSNLRRSHHSEGRLELLHQAAAIACLCICCVASAEFKLIPYPFGSNILNLCICLGLIHTLYCDAGTEGPKSSDFREPGLPSASETFKLAALETLEGHDIDLTDVHTWTHLEFWLPTRAKVNVVTVIRGSQDSASLFRFIPARRRGPTMWMRSGSRCVHGWYQLCLAIASYGPISLFPIRAT